MDKTIRKNVSGFTNNSEASSQPAFDSNRWQPDWPDYTIDIAWPQTPPDLLSIPANQLKQLMLQARAYDPRAIEIFTTLAMPIVKYYSNLPNVVSVLEKDEAYSIANHTMMDFLMHERLRNEKQPVDARDAILSSATASSMALIRSASASSSLTLLKDSELSASRLEKSSSTLCSIIPTSLGSRENSLLSESLSPYRRK